MKTIEKGHMSFAEGYLGPKFKRKEGAYQVDWEKAKHFIEENKEQIESVSVGLAEDWTHTNSELWDRCNGYEQTGDDDFYGMSVWATPAIEVLYKNGITEMYECWKKGNDPYFHDLSEGIS